MAFPGTVRTLGVACALALAVVVPMAASARATDDPMAGAPTVGACSRMTAEQADARVDRSTVVDCATRHSAQVAGVVRLPNRLQWDSATDDDLYRVVAHRCLPEVEALLGRSTRIRDASAYDLLWFAPSKRAIARGARWLSCSVELRQGVGLARLPTAAAPFLPDGRLPDKVARCLTRSRLTTRCSATHRWRATGTFAVAGAYPGKKKLNAVADASCRSRVTPGRSYRWTYQDKITWNAGGDHVVVCYSPSTT